MATLKTPGPLDSSRTLAPLGWPVNRMAPAGGRNMVTRCAASRSAWALRLAAIKADDADGAGLPADSETARAPVVLAQPTVKVNATAIVRITT